jgi:hypothetical protein
MVVVSVRKTIQQPIFITNQKNVMNLLIKKITCFLLAVLFLTACNKENIDEVIPGDPAYQPDTVVVNSLMRALVPNPSGSLDLGCISINYPFSLETESGATVVINSTTEFEAAIEELAADPVVNFVFPLSITGSDGTTSQVNNNQELGVAFASCIPTFGWDTAAVSGEILPVCVFDEFLCLDITYPANLEDQDGNTYVAENEAELINYLATVEHLYFTLPMTVLEDDGTSLVINNIGEFFDAAMACEGITPPVVGDGIQVNGFGCYDLLYPFNVVKDNGDVITLNNENEYAYLILSGVSFEIQYPFSLVNPTGNTVVVNSFDDFITTLNECGANIVIDTADICDVPAHILLYFNQGQAPFQCGYLISFPTQVEAEGTLYDLNDMLDYYSVYGQYSNQIDKINIVYPVSVTLSDGTTLTFNNDNDVCQFIDGC